MTAPARVGGGSSRDRSQSRRKAAAEADAKTAANPAKNPAKNSAKNPAAPESTEAPPRAARRPRTAAAERAYARRAQREGRAGGEPVQRRPRQAKPKHERGPASRASFVMLVMGLLVTGVITTLWLSTQAIADSYRLDLAKKEATQLAEQVELLQREVTNLGSPATLDELARKLGMIPPSGDPARLVVGPDGKVTVVGEPKPAAPPAPPAPPPTTETPPPASATGTPGGNG